jgi:Fibronectin type III domain
MARVQPPGKMPGRRRWMLRLLGACLTAAVLSWPTALASAATGDDPAPTGLSATAEGSSQITLRWNEPTPTPSVVVTGYEIYRGTSPGQESAVVSTKATSYPMTGLTGGTTYYFEVTAFSESCIDYPCSSPTEGPPSTEVSVTTGSVPSPPEPPTGLTATAAGNSRINLSWAAPTAVAGATVTGYKIYDGTSSGAESLAGSSNGTSDTVTGLNSGTTYYFEVSAVYQSCIDSPCQDVESPRSTEASATTSRAVGGRASQVIQFGRLAWHVVGVRFTVVASASSGLQVSFGSDTPGVCSVSGLQVATINPGRCAITASQDGNAHYKPAQTQTRSFRVKSTVGRRLHRQSITFARPANEAAQRPVRLSASASSGLPVSFRSDTPSVCSVSGRRVTIIKPGICTITATQAGNIHYAPAPDQTRSFQVGLVPSRVSRALVIMLALLLTALVIAGAAGALQLRQRRRTRRPPPPPRVRAEPHPDPPGTVRLRITGPDVRGSVRIEPHQAHVDSRLERAQP